MPLTPALIEQLAPVARALASAPRGAKAGIKAEACQRLGLKLSTLHRYLAEVSVRPARKRRADAGRSQMALADVRLLSVTLMQGFRDNNRKIMSLGSALERLRANCPGFACRVDENTGELLPLSDAACARALRQAGLHPQQLRQPTPAQPLASDHPNHVWQVDASLSTLYYVPGQGQDGLQHMSPGEFYKNKPENFTAIARQRLTRWCITDHYSGWVFVHYVAGGESLSGLAEAFIAAMQSRADQGMHGVPFMLMLDPGSAGSSAAFAGLLRRLGVELIVNQAGNPRAKGQVEKAHHLVECDFESGFKLTHVPDLAWINHQAGRWMRYFNERRVHARHGATRSAKWREIRSEQLRLAPAPELCRQLLAGKAERREVSGPFLHVRFAGKTWDVGAVPGVAIGGALHLSRHPYDERLAYVVLHEGSKDEVLVEVPEVQLDAGGFAVGAARIGQQYKRPADTEQDRRRKEVEQLARQLGLGKRPRKRAGALADAQTEAPPAPVIDPYKHLSDLPAVIHLPRRGTPLLPAAQVAQPAQTTAVQAAPPRLLPVFEAAALLAAPEYVGQRLLPEQLALLRSLHPKGVPEDQLPTLSARLKTRAALRVVGGGQ